MSRDDPTARLLIISDDPAEGDQAVNLLRKAGLSVQAQDIPDEAALQKEVVAGHWDLLLIFNDNSRVQPSAALALLRRLDKDIPCIVLMTTETASCKTLFDAGARDCIQHRDTSRLVHAVQRELSGLQERRAGHRVSVALRELEQRHHLLLDSASSAVTYLHEGMHIYSNQAYAQLFGYSEPSELLSVAFLDLVAPADVARVKQFLRNVAEEENSLAFTGLNASGETMHLSMQCAVVLYEGERSLQLILREHAGNVDHENRAREIQATDLLTGLMNRTHFLERVGRAISRAAYENIYSSVILFQLNHFDETAPLIGRSDANLLLGDAGRCLQKLAPKEALVARIEESEFALLLPAEAVSTNAAGLDELGLHLDSEFNRELRGLVAKSLELNSSMGVTTINEQTPDAETVIARARHNLAARKSQSSLYSDSSPGEAELVLERLNQAFENELFILAYQPIVSLKADGLEHYEIRIRMHDNGRLVYPAQFLETANQHGLGEKLDRWVITRSIEVLQERRRDNLRFTINLTQNSVTNPAFLPWLNELLQATRQSVDQIVLQLSEIDIVSAPQQVKAFCLNLQQLNIKLSLTHFGCTLNPFQYLMLAPAQFVKLDKSLLDNIVSDSAQKERLINTVNSLHAQGLRVIAPMISRIEVLPLLWEAGLNFVQGNCLQEPSDKMDFSFVQDEEITLSSFQS